MNIGKIEKTGMSILILALVFMILLIVLGKTIPDFLAWTFFAGMIIVFVGSLITISKK